MAITKVTTPVTGFESPVDIGLKIPVGTNSNLPTGVEGMIRNDTDEDSGGTDSTTAITFFNGTDWKYFNSTVSPDPDPAFSVRYLVIAGGGGGGNYYYGGGGGAGGFRTSFGTGNENGGLTPVESYLQGAANINYTVTVGTAGNGGSNSGQSSQLVLTSTITSAGGGGGGTQAVGIGGGSGGGGAIYPTNYAGGAANTSPTQGFSGGAANNTGPYNAGAGGGGAGEIGKGGASTAALGGKGGDGIESLITGTAVYYAGGGAGGFNRNYTSFTPQGGLGGGGDGAGGFVALAGTNGLGGGGGGGSHASYATGNGMPGGSGVVIIRYLAANSINIVSGTSPVAADLNATVSGSTEKFTRFTATGTVTFTIT